MVFTRKRKSGTVFYVSYQAIPGGDRRQMKSGPCRKTAELHEARLALDYQRYLATGVYEEAELSLPEELEVYLAELAQRVEGRQVELCRTRIECFLAHGGDLPAFLDDLLCGKVIVRHARRSGGVAPKTRDEYGSAVFRFGAWLDQTGRRRGNPFRHFFRVFRSGRDETFSRRSLSLVEMHKLTAHADPSRAVLYWVAATTGMRLGELRALQWRDIDLGSVPHIRLPAFRNGERLVKNGKDVMLPLQPWVARMLRPGPDPTAHVFVINERIAEQVRKDATAAGLDIEGLDFHALRSTMFTLLKDLGVDDVYIQKMMRHAHYDTTLSHYAKVKIEALAGAVAIPDPR